MTGIKYLSVTIISINELEIGVRVPSSERKDKSINWLNAV